MQYRADPMYGNTEGFDFDALEDVRKAGRGLKACKVIYNGHDPLVRDLFRILSAGRGAEQAIEVIERLNGEERVILLYRLRRQGLDPRGEFSLPVTFEGRIVADSREVEPEYGEVQSEEDAMDIYLRELIDFENCRGILLKRDFWRFFDYKAFLKHREVVSFALAGVFYVLMLYPYNYK